MASPTSVTIEPIWVSKNIQIEFYIKRIATAIILYIAVFLSAMLSLLLLGKYALGVFLEA